MSDSAVIELRNVSLSYENRPIFKHVDFKLNNSEFCYLIGPTGIGKSSVFEIVISRCGA